MDVQNDQNYLGMCLIILFPALTERVVPVYSGIATIGRRLC